MRYIHVGPLAHTRVGHELDSTMDWIGLVRVLGDILDWIALSHLDVILMYRAAMHPVTFIIKSRPIN